MKNLILRGIVVGPVQTNCYFLKHKETGELVIADPGAEAERIIYRWKNCRKASGHIAYPWSLCPYLCSQ